MPLEVAEEEAVVGKLRLFANTMAAVGYLAQSYDVAVAVAYCCCNNPYCRMSFVQ